MVRPRLLRVCALVLPLAIASACSDDAGDGSVTSGDQGRTPAPGVTDDEIDVGILYAVGWQQAGEDAGVSGGGDDDLRAVYQALVDDLNSSGGVAGHHLVPHYGTFDVLATDGNAEEQANCAAMTQDHAVFAVLAPNYQTDSFRTCVEQAGAVYVGWGGASASDQTLYEQFPHYVEAGSMSLSRLAPVLVERLDAQGFFDGGTVGLAYFDTPAFVRTVENVLTPALADAGVHLAADASIPAARTAADLGAMNAAIQNAVLRFRDAEVDRVLFFQQGVTLPTLFMNGANNQGYQPTYALSSNDGVSTIAERVPPSTLTGSVGIGWLPSADLGVAGGWTPSAAEADCLDQLRDHGLDAHDHLATLMQVTACSQVELLRDALRGRNDDLTADSFIEGIEGLADTVEPLIAMDLFYGPGQHDGAKSIRDFEFDAGCPCFRYRE